MENLVHALSGPLGQVELGALLAASAMVLAALFARVRSPGAPIRSGLQHFAAGVVFSTVGVELLPDLTRSHAIREVVIGFAAGVALLLAVRKLTDEPAPSAAIQRDEQRLPIGMLTAVGIDILLDGVLVGVGFTVGVKEGWMLTAALGLELVSLGFAIGASLSAFSGKKVAGISGLLGLLLLLGAGAGLEFVSHFSPHLLAGVIAFGCAALLFLATEELLVEAHESGESPFATAMFFAGFLVFLVVGMLG